MILLKHLHEKVEWQKIKNPGLQSTVAVEKLNKLRFELIPHPLYFPDLTPSDFFLFPNLKKCLCRNRCYSRRSRKIAIFQFECPIFSTAWKICKHVEPKRRRWEIRCILHNLLPILNSVTLASVPGHRGKTGNKKRTFLFKNEWKNRILDLNLCWESLKSKSEPTNTSYD